MRAWLLILAVLATLQITTQVASTEDQQIQEIHQKQNSNPDLENSSSPSPPPPSTSSYSLPVIVNTSTSKLSDSLSDDSNQVQGDSEDESQSDDDSLSYHREKITLKPDTENLVEVQNTLLQLIGLKRRPRNLDRSKIIIPEAMKKLYAEIMGQELDSINIPKPGLHTKTANTVRSFSHQGELLFYFYIFKYLNFLNIMEVKSFVEFCKVIKLWNFCNFEETFLVILIKKLIIINYLYVFKSI